MRVLVFLVIVAAAASAAPSAWDCKHDDAMVCVGLRAVAYMEKLARMQTVQIFEGVTFEGTGDVDRTGRALSEAELDNALPQEPSEKASRLLEMLMDVTLRFLQKHNLQFKLPETAPAELQRAFHEGRGKIKKTILPIIIGVAAKIFAVIPLFLGGLALVATKALVIAKIAFVIVAVIGLQKLLSGGGGLAGLSKGGAISGWSSGGGSSYSPSSSGGWSSGNSGGPYHRSFNDKDAQELAYGSS